MPISRAARKGVRRVRRRRRNMMRACCVHQPSQTTETLTTCQSPDLLQLLSADTLGSIIDWEEAVRHGHKIM